MIVCKDEYFSVYKYKLMLAKPNATQAIALTPSADLSRKILINCMIHANGKITAGTQPEICINKGVMFLLYFKSTTA